ncbi:unnamed protein product [Musa banksii]
MDNSRCYCHASVLEFCLLIFPWSFFVFSCFIRCIDQALAVDFSVIHNIQIWPDLFSACFPLPSV